MEHKLLIEPYITKKFLWRRSRVERPVDSSPFCFELKITNKGPSDFQGGTISNIKISQEKIGFLQTFGKKLRVQKIKSEKSKELLVSEKVIFPQSGLYWVDCKVEASDGKGITLKQRMLDGGMGSGRPKNKPLGWCRNPLLVVNSFQRHQKWTNRLLLALTIIMVVLTIFLVLRG